MGALVGRSTRDPPLLPPARVLSLAAQQPVVARRPHDGARYQRAHDGGSREGGGRGGGGRPPGTAHVRDGAPRGGGSGAGVPDRAAGARGGPAAGADARAAAGRARRRRLPPRRRGGGGRRTSQAAGDVRALRGGAVALSAAAAAGVAPGHAAAGQLADQRLGSAAGARLTLGQVAGASPAFVSASFVSPSFRFRSHYTMRNATPARSATFSSTLSRVPSKGSMKMETTFQTATPRTPTAASCKTGLSIGWAPSIGDGVLTGSEKKKCRPPPTATPWPKLW